MCPNDYSARLVFVKVASNCLLSRSWNIWTICQKMDEGWRRLKLRLTKVSRRNCVINGQTAPTCSGFVGFVFKQNLIAANFLICFWRTVAFLRIAWVHWLLVDLQRLQRDCSSWVILSDHTPNCNGVGQIWKETFMHCALVWEVKCTMFITQNTEERFFKSRPDFHSAPHHPLSPPHLPLKLPPCGEIMKLTSMHPWSCFKSSPDFYSAPNPLKLPQLPPNFLLVGRSWSTSLGDCTINSHLRYVYVCSKTKF